MEKVNFLRISSISRHVLVGFLGASLYRAVEDDRRWLFYVAALIVLAVLDVAIGFFHAKKNVQSKISYSGDQTNYDVRVIEAAFAAGVRCSVRSDSTGLVKLWAVDGPSTETALCLHYCGDCMDKEAVEKAFALEMEAVNKFVASKRSVAAPT